MKPILNYNDVIRIEEDTIHSKYKSQSELMNAAGKSIAEYILENINDPFNNRFKVLAGPGNNGGDAIITHYYLLKYGIDSNLILLDHKHKDSWIFNQYSINKSSIIFNVDLYDFDPLIWYVDGIFGIGLKRNIDGKYKKVIDNLQGCPNVISIDIPSGIYCDTGLKENVSVSSYCTLVMGYLKVGHCFNDGIETSGDLHILDIGFKPDIKQYNSIQLIEISDVKNLLPKSYKHDNKYSKGKLLSITGSIGYTGAAILSSQSAYKAGVGILKLITPSSINSIYENNIYESITVPIEDYSTGYLSNKNINSILNEIKWADAILFGPGLLGGKSDWMFEILKNIKSSVILDGSGFRPLYDNIMNIKDLPAKTILTPHLAEFSKIFKYDISSIKNDPISCIKKIIPILDGRVLILKGPTTVIVSSNSKIYFINNGEKNLATAGTGDVLSGILAALVAQGCQLDEAALLGTYIHGECIQYYNKYFSLKGFTASNMPDLIPLAMEYLNDIY